MPLPVAALMSREGGDAVATGYGERNRHAKRLRSTLRSPLMTLGFMALLMIPEFKLSDRGLFGSCRFRYVRSVIADGPGR